MKYLLLILSIVFVTSAMAQKSYSRVGATEYSYSHVGTKYTFYLFSQFAFGSGEGPHVSGYLTQKSNDTLYVKALYNTVGVWAAWYGVSYDTIPNIEKDKDVNYFNVSSNSYYYNEDTGVKSDTNWHDDDTVFNVNPTAISAIDLQQTLLAIFPNPAKNTVTISFNLAESSKVHAVLYDVTGKEVMMLINNPFVNGKHTEQITLDKIPAGSYFVKLSAGEYSGWQNLLLTE